MAIVTSTFGRRGLLGAARTYLATLYLRAFANDITPTDQMDAGDFVEPTFMGYSPRLVASWSPPFTTTARQAQTDAPAIVWTVGNAGGNDQLFGYWLSDANGNYVLAERFSSGPVDMILPGATCPVQLRVLSGPLC